MTESRRVLCSSKAMANAFTSCASCRCLVKSDDSVCPFCGAVVVQRAAVAHRVQGPRMSRAMWLAFGSSIATAAGLACSSSHTPPTATAGSAAEIDPTQGSGNVDARASDPAVIDAGSERANGDPFPTATCDAGTGCACTPCGKITCDTATEYCEYRKYACAGAADCTFETEPSACVPRTNGVSCGASANATCTQDVCGRVVVEQTIEDCCHACGMGCATSGCYGSPPARLERRYSHSIA